MRLNLKGFPYKSGIIGTIGRKYASLMPLLKLTDIKTELILSGSIMQRTLSYLPECRNGLKSPVKAIGGRRK